MKLKMKLIAAALVLGTSAVAHADIQQSGGGSNGELFFSIWDATGSYTRGLGFQIDTVGTNLGIDAAIAGATSPGLNVVKTWAQDTNLQTFLGAHTGPLSWNVLAWDQVGAKRLVTTYAGSSPSFSPSSTNTDSATSKIGNFVGLFNTANAGTTKLDQTSTIFVSGVNGYAPDAVKGFGGSKINNLIWNTAGTYNGADSVLNVLRTGNNLAELSNVFHPYADTTFKLGANGTLSLNVLTPIPEPETYALLLAGLGMMAAIGRRRLKA